MDARTTMPTGIAMTDVISVLRPHERKLAAYIVRRSKDPGRSEDVLQETFLTVMRQAQKQEITQPLAYAYRVADSLIYAQARRDRREEPIGDEDFGCDLPLPDAVLEHKQRAAVFEAALKRLSPLRRDIFMRRHLDDQSRQAIADDLKITVEAVKKHLVRAMAELAGAMQDAAVNAAREGRGRDAR
jgi:RNA polymerase sigma factor (sigma-70 family)